MGGLTLRRRAFEEIRRLILSGAIAPGSPLSEYALAERLKMSRTPIREGLRDLESAGLVRSLAQYGMFVRQMTVQDIYEIYQIRIELESMAAGVAAERMDPAQIDILRAELGQAEEMVEGGSNDAAVFPLTGSFHKRLVDITGNERLKAVLSTLDDQIALIRTLAGSEGKRGPTTVAEHRAIIDAIAAHDRVAAYQAMRAHSISSRNNALQSIAPGAFAPDQSQADGVSPG